MSNLIEDILSNIDIVDVIGRYVNLKKSGANYSGLCPFHSEKTPSFVVSPDKQIYKCFGCGAGGNAINFMMELEKIEFMDAAKVLAEDAGIDISQYRKKPSTQEESKTNQKETIKELNSYVDKFFIDTLSSSSHALDYLKKERNLSDEVIKKFSIGFAPDNYYELIKFLKSKNFSDDDIVNSGLAKKGNSGDLYSFFRNRVMFSIYDHMDNPVAFAGRGMSSEDTPKYLNIPETPVYDKSKVLYGLNIAKKNIKNFDKLVVVEGYMDVIGLYRLGYPVGVATCGTSLTGKHVQLLKRFTRNVVFSFDSDQAGFDATIRGLKLCFSGDIYPQILKLPQGYKDLDELANDGYDSSQLLSDKNLQEGFDYVLDSLLENNNLDSPNGRKEVINKSFDIIANISDYSVLMFYIEKLSSKTSTNVDVLFRQFKTYIKNQRNMPSQKNSEEENSKNNNGFEEKYVLASLFWDEFLVKNKIDTEKINEIVETITVVSGYFPDSFLQKVFEEDITEEEKDKILEAQLWWERQFSQQSVNPESVVVDFLKKQMHKFSRTVLKSKEISNEEKNDLIQMINKFKK